MLYVRSCTCRYSRIVIVINSVSVHLSLDIPETTSSILLPSITLFIFIHPQKGCDGGGGIGTVHYHFDLVIIILREGRCGIHQYVLPYFPFTSSIFHYKLTICFL